MSSVWRMNRHAWVDKSVYVCFKRGGIGGAAKRKRKLHDKKREMNWASTINFRFSHFSTQIHIDRITRFKCSLPNLLSPLVKEKFGIKLL